MISISFKSSIRIPAITMLLVATAMTMHAQVSLPAAGDINTVVGSGAAGYSGDNGPATAANLSVPEAVAVDAAGNIFIADTFNNVIRKVAASTGYISTVAGNGTQGYSGDGGPATLAELYLPTGVAVDVAGNIYFADNQRIRKVTASTGIITTVAGSGIQGFAGDGGPATSAELNWPWAVALDAAGNIYFTDTDNQRIRKVAVSTGIITTVAGTGTEGCSGDGGPATNAELNSPFGIAVDEVGNIYFTDYFNNRIRRVAASTGDVSTVAGNGTQGYSGDGAAATNAEIYRPMSVAVDAVGNIYIADEANDRVRIVTASTGTSAPWPELAPQAISVMAERPSARNWNIPTVWQWTPQTIYTLRTRTTTESALLVPVPLQFQVQPLRSTLSSVLPIPTRRWVNLSR